MKLIKLLALAAPVALLASCGGSEEAKDEGLHSATILEKSGLTAEAVVKYEITLDSNRLTELTGQNYEEKGTTKESEYRIFYTKGEKVADKALVVYTQKQQNEISTANFKDFTSATEIKLDSTTKGLLTDTGQVKEDTFKGLAKLQTVDLTNFDFKATTSLKGLFQNDKELTSVVFTGSKTEKITSLESTFEGTKIATTVMSGLDTKKVENFHATFKGTTQLATVDLSAYSFESVTDVSNMFEGACTAQATATAPTGFSFASEKKGTDYVAYRYTDGKKVEVKATDTFKDIKSADVKTTLEKVQVPSIDAATILAFTGLTVEKVKKVVITTDEGKLDALKADDETNDIADINTAAGDKIRVAHSTKANLLLIQSDTSGFGLFEMNKSLFEAYTQAESIEVTEKSGQALLDGDAKIAKELFAGNTTVTSVVLNLNPQATTSVEGLFKGASKLTHGEVKFGATTKVTDLTSLFEGTAIASVNDDTKTNEGAKVELQFEKVERYDAMFKDCENLATVKLGAFKFTKAKSIASMFEGASTKAKKVTVEKPASVGSESGTDFKVLTNKATKDQVKKNDLLILNESSVVLTNHGASSVSFPTLADNLFESANAELKTALVTE